MNLIVTEPFGPYQKGERITDHAAITAILNSENATLVVRVAALPQDIAE